MAASTSLTPEQRTLRARRAAHAKHALHDPSVTAAAGQAGLVAKFDRQAREATPGLTDAEYARRAGQLYKAHMAGLALASSKARQGGGRDAA